MMQVTSGQDVSYAFAVAVDGMDTVPDQALMRVSGPNGYLADWTAVQSDGAIPPSYQLTVPGVLNTLATNAVREARVIEIEINTGATGSQRFTIDYLVTIDADELMLMANSFQNYPQAIANASLIPATPGWDAAEPLARKTALMSAYDDLSHMDFSLTVSRDDVYYRSRASWGLPVSNLVGKLYLYSANEFTQLSPDFKRKIALAQVAEADSRLTADPALAMRDAGLVQKTTGDDSATFRARLPLRLRCNRRTYLLLSPYLMPFPQLARG